MTPFRHNLEDKRIVLCVEEGVTLLLLERTLGQAGLLVVGKAQDGQEAVEIVLRERPDLVLMNTHLSGVDGLEAARQILSRVPTCVVMLTASMEEEHLQQIHTLGIAGYISKPFTSALLLPALHQALTWFYECLS